MTLQPLSETSVNSFESLIQSSYADDDLKNTNPKKSSYGWLWITCIVILSIILLILISFLIYWFVKPSPNIASLSESAKSKISQPLEDQQQQPPNQNEQDKRLTLEWTPISVVRTGDSLTRMNLQWKSVGFLSRPSVHLPVDDSRRPSSCNRCSQRRPCECHEQQTTEHLDCHGGNCPPSHPFNTHLENRKLSLFSRPVLRQRDLVEYMAMDVHNGIQMPVLVPPATRYLNTGDIVKVQSEPGLWVVQLTDQIFGGFPTCSTCLM